jgi:hypothetical protein
MIKYAIKTFSIAILSVLIFSTNVIAQDSLKIATKKRITWLTNMVSVKSPYDLVDSLKVLGYRGIAVPAVEADATEQGGMFKIPGTKEVFMFSCHDEEHIENCSYITDDKAMYEQVAPLILKDMGFEYNHKYSDTTGDETYSKGAISLVLKQIVIQGKAFYSILVKKF